MTELEEQLIFNIESVINKEIKNVINSEISIDKKKEIIINTKNMVSKILDDTLDELDNMENKYILENSLKEYKKNHSIYTDDNCILEDKYEVDIDLQNLFYKTLYKMNIESDGTYNGNMPEYTKIDYIETFKKYKGFENDVFYIKPYNWNGISYIDCKCGLDDRLDDIDIDFSDLKYHSEECYVPQINFFYRPLDLKIEWNQYPSRNSFSNHKLDYSILKAILNDCINSLNK